MADACTWLAVAVLAICTAYSALRAYRDGLFELPRDDAERWARRLIQDAERDGDAWDAELGVHLVAPILSRRTWQLHRGHDTAIVPHRKLLLAYLAEVHRDHEARQAERAAEEATCRTS